MKKVIFGFAAAVLMGGVFVSCTNEANDFNPGASGVNGLVHAPDIYVWSGGDNFGTRGACTRSVGAPIAEFVKTSALDREAEAAFVNERLPEKNGNLDETMNTNGFFYTAEETTFEMYPVFSQTDTPNNLGLFYYDADGGYHEMIIWADMTPWNLSETNWSEPKPDSWVEDPNHWSGQGGYYAEYGVTYSKGIRVTVPAGCKFGFFWKGNTNSSGTVYYSDFAKNEEVNRTDGGGNPVQPEEKEIIHFVSFEANGKTYAGLEDWTDFDYQDWVFTFDRILLTEKPSETPEIPDVTPDPEYGGEGDLSHNDEVEVNYSINDSHNTPEEQKYAYADLWTKLSIHVRKGTDVKITVPLPGRYLCESDDFAIFQNHEIGVNTGDQAPHYTATSHSMTYTIEDVASNQVWNVTLTVSFENDAIVITTDGINQELIDYLYAKNGDGINFEIWNYFQTETVQWIDGQENKEVVGTLDPEDYEAFQGYLDQSTIEFLDSNPSFYINAFGYNYENGRPTADKHPRHCVVTPVNPRDFSMTPNYCWHLNETPWNIIWVENGVDHDSLDYFYHTIHGKPAVPVE